MEENKLDIYQIIGFLFLIAAVFWWFNVTIPNLEQNALEEKEIISQTNIEEKNNNLIKDVTEIINSNNNINSSAIGSELESEEIIIENEDVIFKFNTKGGSLTELQLKDFVDYTAKNALHDIGIKYNNSAPKSTPIPWFNKHSDTSKKQTALQESESTNYVIGVMSETLDYDALPNI